MRKAFLLLLTCISITAFGQHTGYIQAGKLKVYYEAEGKGSPLLMLHAGYLNLHLWDKQAAYFSKRHRVIRFDMPGCGKTTGADTVILIQDIVRTLLDSLHIRKGSFIGESIGASSLVDFALAYPERIDKLVLASPGLSGWHDVLELDSVSKQLFLHIDSVALTHNKPLIAETFTHLWFDGPTRTASAMNANDRAYVYNAALATASSEGKSFPVFNKNTAAKRLNMIHLPVFILAGQLDIPFIVRTSYYLHDHIAGSQIKVIPTAAHLINLEKPGEFNEVVGDFLGR